MKIIVLCFAFLISLSLLSQSLVINEAMSRNGITIYDQEGDTPDWLELYNASSSTINLSNFGLSDDNSDLFKWILPDISLESDEHLLIFASSKNRRFSHLETIIDWGAEWKYFMGFAEPPSDWREIDFDDSIWFTGPTGIGCGDDDDTTIIPIVGSYYLRHTFTIEDTTKIVFGILHVDYDDAFVAYLNGTEIARANIGTPGIIPAYNDFAEDSWEANIYQGGLPEQFFLPDLKAHLIEGENVLSIQTHNITASSSDLTMIPFLTLAMTETPVNPHGYAEILQSMQPDLHSNFKISSSGETLYLVDENMILLDSLFVDEIPTDVTVGCQPDGSENIYFFNEPTPEESNTSYGYQNMANLPIFSLEGGFYNGYQTIELSGAGADETIYYTLDGSDPVDTSIVYIQPITIDTTHVIRARILSPNSISSPIVTHTYFIDRYFTLPVISLATTPANFFDWETGIYVMGPNASPDPPYSGANFWEDWERPIHIEMFNLDGSLKFSEDAGTKIHGRWSRRFDQKSLAIFFRSQYGTNTLNCQVFDEKPYGNFESLLIRNSGNDFQSTHFRDAFVTNITQDQNIEYQEFQPVTLYLNGMYWGIYNLREKISEHFVAANNPGVDPDNIDRLEYRNQVLNGDSTAYHNLMVYFASHDLSQTDNYEYVKTKVNVANLTKYLATNIYCNNTDWPRNNVSLWRERTETSKWHWILDDMDWSFGHPYSGYDDNTIWDVLSTSPSNPNPPEFTFLFRKMFTNQEFQDGFVDCIMDYMNTIFQPTALLTEISSIKAQYELEMAAHIVRWNWGTMDEWYDEVEEMETFASLRPDYMIGHLQNEFDLGNTINVNIDINDEIMGYLELNFITLTDFPFSGSYFDGIPIKITAIPYDGFEFTQWFGSSSSQNPILEITPDSDLDLTANFQVMSGNSSDIVINEINYNSSDDFNPDDWIEIYNISGTNLDLSSWQLKDDDDLHSFIFPTDFSIPADSYIVLCRDTLAFHTLFPDIENYLGNWNFGLGSNSDMVRIFDNEGTLIDHVLYDNEAPWPIEPDGNGPTLSLLNPGMNNLLPQSWAASENHGTPGVINDVYVFADDQNPILPNNVVLYPNYPNPFNPVTTIKYSLPEDTSVTLGIYNVKGQLTKLLINEFQTKGQYTIDWDGNDNNGKPVASGLYFYRIKSNNCVLNQKMLLLK
jgi:CotH kinase protein/Lamin Tail Domain/Chitobiase/beta-hexosaminidase C-terminal domain/FlgD Ig-like domain/Divergent InlB B-repeat domain